MNNFLGWDIHGGFSKVTVAGRLEDGQMQVLERATLDHDDRLAMRRWLARMTPGAPVALEAAFGWPWVADLLEEAGLEPHLAHPPAMKELAKHEAKSDRCDADRLARLLSRGILPESYLAPPEVRQRRERTRYRMALAKVRTSLKNRIQAILHRHGILHPYSDLFGKSGRAFLDKLPLPDAPRASLAGYLRVLDAVVEELAMVEAWMEKNLPEDKIVRLLTTIPGIGLILAHVIRAEIGEMARFPSRRHLASYAGLAPMSDDSADRHGRRHTSAACNHVLRWAFIEAATGAIWPNNKKGGQGLRRLYGRLTHGGRDSKNQAKVAVARELSELVYIIWTKQQPYTERPPARPGARRAGASGPQDHENTCSEIGRPEPRNLPDTPLPSRPRKEPRQARTAEQGAQRGAPCGSADCQTHHSDQPRHPMVRPKRHGVLGQTRK